MSYPPPQGYPPPASVPQGYPGPPAQGQPPPAPVAGYTSPTGGYQPQQQPGGYSTGYDQPPMSQGYGTQQLTNQMGGLNMGQPPTRAGDSAVLSMFSQGNIVILESIASGKSLRISEFGDVQGTGGRGQFAQFRVHIKRPGVVALQNVHNPDHWLAVFQGKTIGTGKGGPHCEFTVNEIEGNFACLESTMFPGQYVGILPNGSVKPPQDTKTGPHGRFIVSVFSTTGVNQSAPPPQYSATPQGQYPPPQQGQYPPPQQGQYPPPQQGQYPPPQQGQYPPPQQGQYYPPPPQAVGPTAPPPPQAGSFPPPQHHGAPVDPNTPQLPTGYNVMDAFRAGNVIQLICRSNGNPLSVNMGAFSTRGQQKLGTNDCNWSVVVPSGVAPGVIMLQNVKWPGMYISIKKGKVESGQGKKFCHLVPRARPDNYVCFMSVECAGQYLGFAPYGHSVDPRTVGENDQNAQFFVRIEKQKHPYSATIMTPFQRPSMANQLGDGYVIQLYLKSSHHYLSITGNGMVQYTANSNDQHTYFRLSDRGMGIYTLNSYKYTGYRLRVHNGAIIGKGIPDLASDFRLKDYPDGMIAFESVISPGVMVGIRGTGGFQTKLAVSLVVIQKFGGSETVTKTPLN